MYCGYANFSFELKRADFSKPSLVQNCLLCKLTANSPQYLNLYFQFTIFNHPETEIYKNVQYLHFLINNLFLLESFV